MRKIYARVAGMLKSPLVSCVRLLPERILLLIKQSAPIIKRLDYSKQEIFMLVDSQTEKNSRIYSVAKEPGTVEWIETFCEEGDVLYDIGANVGAYSLIAAKYFNDNIRIYAFEPHAMNYTKLCRNILLNKCGSSITPLSIALSDVDGFAPFNYRKNAEGTSGSALGKAINSKGQPFAPSGWHNVPAFRLDNFINTTSLPVPNHIKLDVDGIEAEILDGARLVLADARVKSVLVELEKDEGTTSRVMSLMEENGFRLHSLREGRNHIFVR